jgi:hypothetical protein
VCIVRVNQYRPSDYEVNTYLAVPIGDYDAIAEDYIAELDNVLRPWKAHVVNAQGELDRNLFRRKKRETAADTRYSSVAMNV